MDIALALRQRTAEEDTSKLALIRSSRARHEAHNAQTEPHNLFADRWEALQKYQITTIDEEAHIIAEAIDAAHAREFDRAQNSRSWAASHSSPDYDDEDEDMLFTLPKYQRQLAHELRNLRQPETKKTAVLVAQVLQTKFNEKQAIQAVIDSHHSELRGSNMRESEEARVDAVSALTNIFHREIAIEGAVNNPNFAARVRDMPVHIRELRAGVGELRREDELARSLRRTTVGLSESPVFEGLDLGGRAAGVDDDEEPGPKVVSML